MSNNDQWLLKAFKCISDGFLNGTTFDAFCGQFLSGEKTIAPSGSCHRSQFLCWKTIEAMIGIDDRPIELHDPIWGDRAGIHDVVDADLAPLDENVRGLQKIRKVRNRILLIENGLVLTKFHQETALICRCIERHTQSQDQDRKFAQDLLRPDLRSGVEAAMKIRRILLGESSAGVIAVVNASGTQVHPVDSAFRTFLKENEWAKNVSPQRLFAMILAPVNVRAARLRSRQ